MAPMAHMTQHGIHIHGIYIDWLGEPLHVRAFWMAFCIGASAAWSIGASGNNMDTADHLHHLNGMAGREASKRRSSSWSSHAGIWWTGLVDGGPFPVPRPVCCGERNAGGSHRQGLASHPARRLAQLRVGEQSSRW